jgi:O-acetyl-ADP-ribose deacetylase (regulator of RNase III)
VKNHLFITPGDLTQLSAHAVAYSASSYLGADGALYASFAAHFPAFGPWYAERRRESQEPRQVGDTFWLPLDAKEKPHGIVVVVSTGGGRTVEDKAAVAVRAALAEAVRRLREEADGF